MSSSVHFSIGRPRLGEHMDGSEMSTLGGDSRKGIASNKELYQNGSAQITSIRYACIQ